MRVYVQDLVDLKETEAHPCVPQGRSDGGAHTKFSVSAECTTEFLATVVRGGLLEEAYWRLAKNPADADGLLDCGAIAVRQPMDILVIDFDTLSVLPARGDPPGLPRGD